MEWYVEHAVVYTDCRRNAYDVGELSISPLDRLLSLEKRLSGRKMDSDIVRTTGDATLTIVSAVSWAHRQIHSL